MSNKDRKSLFEGTINVRDESGWLSWLTQVEAGHLPLEVVFRRRFNWPRSTSNSDVVSLLVEGVCPDRIVLNQTLVNPSIGEATARCHVRDLLKDSNLLEFVFKSWNPDAPEQGCPGLLRSVVLEIESGDH